MKNKKISIIIPVYNEVNGINALIERILSTFKTSKLSYEVIFIDDHSTDGTFEYIKKVRSGPWDIFPSSEPVLINIKEKIKVYRKKGRRGKAFSLIEGFDKAKGDIFVMIDGDLQYPPEAIPEMIKVLDNADVVVANRKNYKDGIVRKVISNTFRFAFGKLLFGLNHDVQSGLKVMTREVIESIRFTPGSAWTFDLEFLHRSRQAGFVIENFDISFARRENGISKVAFIRTTFEIGVNALVVRRKVIHPVEIPSKVENSMLGAGLGYKKKKYITHTTMAHNATAIRTVTLNQKVILIFICLGIIVGFIFYPLLTLQSIVGLLSFIYFADVLFNLYLILKSLNFPQEIKSTDKEISRLNNRDLPIYTVLCPLYKEARILPQFIDAMNNLSWPKEKLDVILLLEEDDKETIKAVEKMNLPLFIKKLIVPHSAPKTKPKACNYGLAHAKGEYLVIYDAEDMPDTLQLKKAYLGFQKIDKDIICLQAKLNYYNPHQNLLTRLFTAEYSLWFDITLPGLQSMNTTIPLGGTSNHFKTQNLRDVEGWDPFNVTEDADLGMRLFKKGFRTAIIDSITLEEANSKFGNWLRQRSRWIKGYMQTYLVHVREAAKFTREKGRHSLIFQLVIGGKIAFILINPILWLATIAYFTLYAYVGPAIESVYPTVVFYMAVTSLVFGNFLFLYYYMIGVAKKRQWNLMKFVFLVPFYWLMISVAAFSALYQLILKPHYWEKTIHGLHLGKEAKAKLEAEVVLNQERVFGFKLPDVIKKRLKSFNGNKGLYIGGLVLVSVTMIANILNFIFNVYLGRVLPLEVFGDLSLFTSLLYLTSVPLGSFSSTISHNIAYLYGKKSKQYAQGYLKYIFGKSIIFGVALTVLWILLTPFLAKFFRTESIIPIVLFAPLWLIIVASSNFSGYLAGTLSFGKKGLVLLTEAASRLILAFIFVSIGLSNIVFVAILMSIMLALALNWLVSRAKGVKQILSEDKKFNLLFFSTSALNGISLITFLTLDVILVKHFLSPIEAGQYGLLSLAGKMTYFFGSLFGPFMIPLVSHNEGAQKNSKNTFVFLFVITLIFSLGSFISLGLFGNIIVPVIFGDKTIPILPLLVPYVMAMALFTISQPIVSFFQAKNNYSFAIVGFLVALLQILLISIFHTNLAQIVWVVLIVSIINLIFISLLFVFRKKLWVIFANIKDLIGLFVRLREPKVKNSDKLRILIFNWRDTKHKWAGGAEVYIHELAKRWVRDGNTVTIFSGKGGQKSINEKIDGIQMLRRGGFYTVYIWAYFYYIFKFRGKFDVIIDSENGIPFFTPLYAKEKKFLLIHHVHQEVFRKSLKWPFSWFARTLEAKLMPLVYRNVQVITVSPSSKDEILKHKLTKKEPIIIYNGVDLSKFKTGKKSKNPLILYVGRLQYYKSLNIFIKAAKKILEEIPDVKFVIAGEGEERKKLQRLAKRLGVKEKIKFLGKVSEERKIKLFQNAWVFVNPSFMEGWGITTIEAAACGTPAVASDVPGLRDSIRNPHTGILVKYGDHQNFALKILRLIENKKLREGMSQESIGWAQNFSWAKSSKEFLRLIS